MEEKPESLGGDKISSIFVGHIVMDRTEQFVLCVCVRRQFEILKLQPPGRHLRRTKNWKLHCVCIILGGRERLAVSQEELLKRRGEGGVDNPMHRHPKSKPISSITEPSDTIRSLHTLFNGTEVADLNQRLTGLETENLEAHRKVKWQYFRKQVLSKSIAS
jgi:hypothetical protein